MASPINLGNAEHIELTVYRESDLEEEEALIDITDRILTGWRLPTQFNCRWGGTKIDGITRVGYCSGGGRSLLETYEEGLELSRILDGECVEGVYARFGNAICFPENRLRGNWERFFLQHPDGVYLQYTQGSSGRGVERVLRDCPRKWRVWIVALQSHWLFRHKNAVNFTTGRWWWNPSALLVECSDDMDTLHALDPTFYTAIQLVYSYAKAGGDMPSVLLDCLYKNPSLLQSSLRKEPLRSCENHMEIVKAINDASLMHKKALLGKERISEGFLATLSGLVASCLRLADYLMLFTNACQDGGHSRVQTRSQQASAVGLIQSTTSNVSSNLSTTASSFPTTSPSGEFSSSAIVGPTSNTALPHLSSSSNQISQQTLPQLVSQLKGFCAAVPFDYVLWLSWMTIGISQAILIACSYGNALKVRHIALIVNRYGTLLTVLDLIWNLTNFFLLRPTHCLVRIALSLYDIAYLSCKIIRFTLSPVYKGEQRIVVRVANWRKTVGQNKDGTITVNANYRSVIRNVRIFNALLYMLLLGVLFFSGHFLCQERCSIGDMHGVYILSLMAILLPRIFPGRCLPK